MRAYSRIFRDLIDDHSRHLKSLSDQELLQGLTEFAPLPDEGEIESAEDGSESWRRVAEFLAYADEVAERQLIGGVGLLLERASFGDPGETMRGLRHSLEAAVAKDWASLAQICVESASSDRAGARLWAVTELGVLRDPSAIGALALALADPEPLVRQESCVALQMLAQRHPGAVACEDTLRTLALSDPVDFVRRAADVALRQLEK